MSNSFQAVRRRPSSAAPPAGGCRRLLLFFAAAFIAVAAEALPASQALAGGPVLEQTFTTGIANGWVRVERWRDSGGALAQESFPADGRGDQTGQRATFFGSARPSSDRFLLYYAPGWDAAGGGTPVLLVHGANQDADLAWANPNEAGDYGCGVQFCPTSGLMQALSNSGHRVFAISFAHKNGDGYFWAEAIADAIEVVKNATGAATVDVVAWSKGAFNARMYASSLRQAWGTAYRGDIDKLILVGGPNKGIDIAFRHGITYSIAVYPACGGGSNGAIPHDWLVCFGFWSHGPEWTPSSALYPGTAQMFRRWDSVYGLATLEQDWWTTYYGGWGFVSHSAGIGAYLSLSLVDDLRNAGVPASVRTYLLCGSSPDIGHFHNEHTGPSDGLIFIASCSDTGGIGNLSADVTVPLNHLELGWGAAAVQQIAAWLDAP
ncbi:MAG: lipase [Alphaproteobacteria bacterium]|nr:MAG: lipase [Alphaproteobacteria bacterium]